MTPAERLGFRLGSLAGRGLLPAPCPVRLPRGVVLSRSSHHVRATAVETVEG